MMTGLFTFLAGVVALVFYFIKRRNAKTDNPEYQHEKKRSDLAREVARNDEAGANASLDDDLERLRNAVQSNQRGQGDQKS